MKNVWDTLIEQSRTLIEQSRLFAHETTNSYIILVLLPKKASWQYGLKASRTQNFLGEEGMWGMCSYPQVACLTVFHTSNTFTTQVAHLTHWPAPSTMLYNTHFSPPQFSIKLVGKMAAIKMQIKHKVVFSNRWSLIQIAPNLITFIA